MGVWEFRVGGFRILSLGVWEFRVGGFRVQAPKNTRVEWVCDIKQNLAGLLLQPH